jgi:type IV fimbrial biogenesis protein FimT
MDRARGFTLVELLVTVCTVALLLGLAAPPLVATADGMRLSATANTFLAQLHLARSEAIKRNTPVAICKSADGEACSATGGWEQGWIVFHDINNDGLRQVGEPRIQRFAALPAGLRLVGNFSVAAYVSFAGNGTTRMTTGAFQAGTLTVCQASLEAAEARQIVINAIGRPRVQKVVLPQCD